MTSKTKPEINMATEVYLPRLARALRLRRKHEDELNEQGLAFVDKTIVHTVTQLNRMGYHSEAWRALHVDVFNED